MKRSTFKKTKHLRNLSHQIYAAGWHAETRARRIAKALEVPGAKVAMAEVWGRADRVRTHKEAKRSAVWTGARA